MYKIYAPYPTYTRVIVLPNPELGDTEALLSTVAVKRAMDGTSYSYVNSDNNRIYKYNFTLTRAKADELLDFIKTYIASRMRFDTHDSTTIIGYLQSNPVEFVISGRKDCDLYGERVGVNLTIEGIQV